MDKYLSYVEVKSVVDPETYYVANFELEGECKHVEEPKYIKMRQEMEAKNIRGKEEKMSGEAMA